MHEQIISCINEIEKELEEDNLEEFEKEEENELYSNVTSENENEKSKLSPKIINKNNILEKELPDSSNNKSDFDFYHNNKYYNNYI